MTDFVIWIVSHDLKLAESWYKLFSREQLRVERLDTMAALGRAVEGGRGLALVLVGGPDLRSTADLKAFIADRRNLSVITSAARDKTTNLLIAELLESGADDFVPAEIDERVLLCKVKAHLRRNLPSQVCTRTLLLSRNGDLEVDRVRRTIRTGLKGKRPTELQNVTPKEFEILATLICNEERVVTRDLLMEEIWRDKSGQVNVETIDKHVETLRHKLGAYGKHVRTVYGSGYMYKAEAAR